MQLYLAINFELVLNNNYINAYCNWVVAELIKEVLYHSWKPTTSLYSSKCMCVCVFVHVWYVKLCKKTYQLLLCIIVFLVPAGVCAIHAYCCRSLDEWYAIVGLNEVLIFIQPDIHQSARLYHVITDLP